MGVTPYKLPRREAKALETLLAVPPQSCPLRHLAPDRGGRAEPSTAALLGQSSGATRFRAGRQPLGRIDTIFYLATNPTREHSHGLAAPAPPWVLAGFNRSKHHTAPRLNRASILCPQTNPASSHLKRADLISAVGFLAELAIAADGRDPIDERLQDPVELRQL